MKCLFCDSTCTDKCNVIEHDTHCRIVNQREEYNRVTNKNVCVDCGKPRRYRASLCDECRKHKKRVNNRAYKAKKRGVKTCKNDNCKKVITGRKLYCSDDCKPNYNFTETRRLMYEERSRIMKEERKNSDPYKGTVNPKWLEPRGSKRRKEMGLEPTKYSSKQSATHGFVY